MLQHPFVFIEVKSTFSISVQNTFESFKYTGFATHIESLRQQLYGTVDIISSSRILSRIKHLVRINKLIYEIHKPIINFSPFFFQPIHVTSNTTALLVYLVFIPTIPACRITKVFSHNRDHCPLHYLN